MDEASARPPGNGTGAGGRADVVGRPGNLLFSITFARRAPQRARVRHRRRRQSARIGGGIKAHRLQKLLVLRRLAHVAQAKGAADLVQGEAAFERLFENGERGRAIAQRLHRLGSEEGDIVEFRRLLNGQ